MAVTGNKPRRKSKSAVVYIPTAVILILFLMAFGVSVFLKIINIEVIGASVYTKEEIITASGITKGDNMLFINGSSAQSKIYSALPYISEVNIKFDLPDSISINVIEARAIATIKYSEGILIIDSMGKVLEKTNTAPAGLIEVRGLSPLVPDVGNALRAEPADDTRLRQMKEVLAAFEQEGIENDVQYLDIANIAYLSFGYCRRFTVILGTSDNIRYKLSNLSEIIETIESDSEKGTIYLADREQMRWSPDR